MTDKLEAAAAILEFRGWLFDGAKWLEPRDDAGNSALDVAEDMAALLQAHLDVHSEHAARGDAYSRALVDQLAPVLVSWQKVRPNR
jgi:hypothetical protein